MAIAEVKYNIFQRFPGEKVLIVMALKSESGGLFESHELAVNYTGMGMVSAAQSLERLISLVKPDRIINIGTAGSFIYPVGELVEVCETMQRGSVLKKLQVQVKLETITDFKKVKCGTADFVQNEQNKHDDFDIMDMEIHAIAQVCQSHKVKCHSIKYITDASGVNVYNDWKRKLKDAQDALVKCMLELAKTKN